MQPIKLILDNKLKDVAALVKEYGYFDEPKCGNLGCESELSHLIDDWLNNATDLRTKQETLGFNDEDFERLIGAIYVADVIEYEGSNTDAK